MKKFRVLAIADAAFAPTGYGNQAEAVLSRLAARGWDVYQLACNTYDMRLCEPVPGEKYMMYKGIKMIPNTEMVEKLGMNGLYGTKEQIMAIYEELKPDVIWTLNDFYRVGGLTETNQEMIDRWVHWSPVDNPYIGDSWVDFMNRMKFMIFLSNFGWELYAKYMVNHVYLDAVYHAVPSNVFKPLPAKEGRKITHGMGGKFVVITVGRHQPRKMVWLTAMVMGKFLKTHPDAIWLCKSDPVDLSMANHPDFEKDLRITVTREGGDLNRVLFETQHLPDTEMNELYNTGDVFIHLSGGEGFGIPYVESMLAGIPCILTNNTTSPELTGGWEFGLPVKVDKQLFLEGYRSTYDMADIDDALKQLEFCYNDWKNNNSQWLKEAGIKAREFHVKWCDAERVVDRWEDIFYRIIRYNNKLLWASEFGRGVGYTITSEGMIPYMEELGYDIYAYDWYQGKSPILNTHIKDLLLKFYQHQNDINFGERGIQADFFLQESFPNLNGKMTVGWAFAENDKLRDYYVKCQNHLKMILTSSDFCKNVFQKSGVTTEIRIIPPWVDSKKYPILERKVNQPEFEKGPPVVYSINAPPFGPFTFLHIGVAQQRKNTPQLIEAYIQAFPDSHKNNKTKLIIKSNDFGTLDVFKEAHSDRTDIEWIYTSSKPLTHEEMLELYKRSDCYINVSHGEGIGNPDMEALCTGLPVIGSNWDSRQLFLSDEVGWIVPVTHMEKAYDGVGEDAGNWAGFDTKDIVQAMQTAYLNPEQCKEKGAKGAKLMREKFTPENGARAIDEAFIELYWMSKYGHVSPPKKVYNPNDKTFFDEDYYVNQHKYTPDWHEGVAQQIIKITNGLEGNVIDIGCGTGFLMKHLLAHDINVVGIEISQYAVDHPMPECAGRIFYGDASEIPYEDKSFDWAISFSTLEHISEELTDKCLEEMCRVSKRAFVQIAMICEQASKQKLLDEDPSHINIHDFKWWNERMERAGLKIVAYDGGMSMLVESVK